ncbi:hypothetical protein GVAV_001798 [Gurleya vavrai]
MQNINMNITGDKDLFQFLSFAPKDFHEGEKIRKYQLKNGDYIHCVLWNMHFYITGTDIVKILVWRFQNAGRSLISIKKFEEGVFSDLRNLKPGIDASLEGPRSEFLEFLYKNGCIRTQKKQKVFFWYSVPHDALFCDALERDLRRETNIYSYSKYMNNLAHTNYVDPDDSSYNRQHQTLKKKNSVKMAARNKRSSPRDPIFPDDLERKLNYMTYDAFNPTQPDPFLTFGPKRFLCEYNDQETMEDYNIRNVEFGDYDAITPINLEEQELEKEFEMPEIELEEEEKKKSKNEISNYKPNIPNSQGKPQK